jgi:hypothetical protein
MDPAIVHIMHTLIGKPSRSLPGHMVVTADIMLGQPKLDWVLPAVHAPVLTGSAIPVVPEALVVTGCGRRAIAICRHAKRNRD